MAISYSITLSSELLHTFNMADMSSYKSENSIFNPNLTNGLE